MNIDKYKSSTLNIPISTDPGGNLASRELFYREIYEENSADGNWADMNPLKLIFVAIICLILGGLMTAKIFDLYNQRQASELAKTKAELATEKANKEAFKGCVERYLK